MTVGNDVCRIAFKRGHVGILRERPGARSIERHVHGTDLGRDGLALCIGDFAADATREGGAIGKVEREDRIIAHENGSLERLARRVERRDVRCAAPPIVAHREQDAVGILVHQVHALQVDDRVRVGDMEDMPVLAGERAAGHIERGGAAVGVARHGLVDHDAVIEGGVAVALRVIGRQIAVRERDGILALDAHAFRQIRRQSRIRNAHIGGGIDGRRAQAVRRVGTAIDVDRSAATVGANCRRRTAARGDGQVARVRDAATCGHDATRTVARCRDDRVAHVDRRAVAIGAVLGAVASVREDAVRTIGIGLHGAAGYGGRRPAHHEQAGVQAVEVAVIAAIGIARLRHHRIRDGNRIGRVHDERALVGGR